MSEIRNPSPANPTMVGSPARRTQHPVPSRRSKAFRQRATNISDAQQRLFEAATSANLLPSGSRRRRRWDVSFRARQRPIASNFSIDKPTVHRLWQLADRIAAVPATRERRGSVDGVVLQRRHVSSGGGGGTPRIFSVTHFPRMTGDIRVA
jgi:hypothetical protein